MKESESSGDEKRNAWLAGTASRCRAWPVGKVDQEIKRVLKLSPHDDSVELGIGDPRREDA